RAPLHTVAGLLDLLVDRFRGDLAEDAGLLVDRAVAGVGRAQGRVGQLLEYARVVTEDPVHEAVDLAGALADAEGGLRSQLEAAGAKVSAENLPTVRGDRDQLARLFA